VRFVAAAGTQEFAKRWNPQPGDIVSFKHHGFLFATKKPKFPALYRLRPDLIWSDVVANWKEQRIKPLGTYYYSLFFLPNFSLSLSLSLSFKSLVFIVLGMPLHKPKVPVHPRGYWRNIENRRKFFLGLAEVLGFDPTVSDNWNALTQKYVAKNKVHTSLSLSLSLSLSFLCYN